MRLFLTIFIFFAVSAEASQFSRCTTYLLSARTNHVSPSISDEYTRAAFQELSMFRGRHAPHIRKETAARIATLFHDRKVITQQTATGLRLREKIYGSIYEGQIEIRSELEARENSRRAAEVLPLAIASRAIPILHGSMYTAIGTLFAAILPFHHDPLIATIASALFIATRNYPEQIVRSMYEAFGPAMDDQKLLEALNRTGEGRWTYRSVDIPIPLEVVQRIWQTGNYTNADYDEFLGNYLAPRATYALTTNNLLLPGAAQVHPNSGWIRIDELIVHERGEPPKLITFVRVSERLPIYPKTFSVPEGEILGMTLPKTIPVR